MGTDYKEALCFQTVCSLAPDLPLLLLYLLLLKGVLQLSPRELIFA